MSWVFVGEVNARVDRYRCDHSEATVGWSDAGFPIGHCPCCHASWRRDMMESPDANGLSLGHLFLKPIPTFVPVELAVGWRGYA